MVRKAKYFKEVERLIDMGMEPKQIIKVTGIPSATVYRIRDKLIAEARYDFKTLLEGDYVWKYLQTIANFSKTIQQCNERIDGLAGKYAKLEQDMRQELEVTPPKMAMVRATLLQGLANLQSAQTAELRELVNQRDKASESKAKTYNQGPFVHALDELIKTGKAEAPRLKEVEDMFGNKPEVSIDDTADEPQQLPQPTQEPTDDDLDVLREMDEDNNS